MVDSRADPGGVGKDEGMREHRVGMRACAGEVLVGQ